jgi:hypothetical protein
MLHGILFSPLQGSPVYRLSALDKLSCSLMPQLVLQPVHNLFQNELSTGCDILLPLSISSILPFPLGHPVTAYVFFLVFPELMPILLSSLL